LLSVPVPFGHGCAFAQAIAGQTIGVGVPPMTGGAGGTQPGVPEVPPSALGIIDGQVQSHGAQSAFGGHAGQLHSHRLGGSPAPASLAGGALVVTVVPPPLPQSQLQGGQL
jgi:hypothetical protein